MIDYVKQHTAKIVAFALGFLVAFVFLGASQKASKENMTDELINKAMEENAQDIEVAKETINSLVESQQSVINSSATSSDSNMVYDFLKISDQKAGNTVSVAYVKAEYPVWLVVHMEKDGKIWNALGARLKDKGEWTGVEVPLLANTKAGSRYWLALYKDNGDNKFDLKEDFPLKGGNGEFILLPFNVVQ